MRNLLEEIYDNLIEGKAQEVKRLTEKALRYYQKSKDIAKEKDSHS